MLCLEVFVVTVEAHCGSTRILIIVLPLSALEMRCDLCRARKPVFELPTTASVNPWPLIVVMAVSGLFVALTVED